MSLKKPKRISNRPGVYIFSYGSKPLYVGKAINLKKRVVSYFRKSDGLPPKIQKMLGEATTLKSIETGSEIEALIKEAELIKRYRPKYNSLMRDDKNYFFVGITKENFPRIFITHQPYKTRSPKPEVRNKSQSPMSKAYSGFGFRVSGFRYFGPFTSGGALHTTLKLLRRVFPYCTCKGTHKRPCLNSQIGKCPGFCCTKAEVGNRKSDVSKRRPEYGRNIRSIVAVLMGQKPRLTAKLKKRMKAAVKNERYEEAAKLRDQIFGLEDIFRHRGLIRHQISKEEGRGSWLETEAMLRKTLKSSTAVIRIEGYDISNIAGKEATGSMVVFTNGQADKSQYRKFRIKTVIGINDVDMIKEVLTRRLKHAEWPHPQLIVVDGGKGQLGAALKALRKSEIRSPRLRRRFVGQAKSEVPVVAALAKREEILYIEGGRAIALKKQDPVVLRLFQRIRDESHRFARAYHHKLREKAFLQK